jgi:hypothetical protein
MHGNISRIAVIGGTGKAGRKIVDANLRSVPGGSVRATDLAAFILVAAIGGSYLREAPFVAIRG